MSGELNSCLMENCSAELIDASDIDKSIHTMKYIWNYNTLSIFDAKNSQVENISLPAGQVLDKHGAKCLLPDGSLFYNNGLETIIIDSEYHIKSLPRHSEQSLDACAVYKDGQIYLLGGTYNNSAKFNIADNKWIPLPTLPISLGSYTYGAAFRQYILLVSMITNKIIYYDTIIDSYNVNLLPNLKKIRAKSFFVINETVYLIDFSQYIYKSTDYLGTWSIVAECSILAGNAPIISTPLIYNQKVYFANYYAIYSFNLMKKKIKKLINLPIIMHPKHL